MRNIYCFSLFEAGYSSIHSLIRELFDSPRNICPSLSQGDLLYVLSKTPPVKSLHHNFQKIDSVSKASKIVKLETHVAFCNKHVSRRDTGGKTIVPKKMYPKEALEKFCFLSGLKEDKATCEFLGPQCEKKFHVHNAFHIEGLFHILDHDKFNQALTEGIGSRKSYGYGLILIKEGEKHESAS